jgi:nucleolar complex protein 2
MDDDDNDDDGASFASVDELEGARICLPIRPRSDTYVDEGATHMLELSKLADKDPEFYRYLQEHDSELLDFNMDDDDNIDDADEDADDEDTGQLPVLTENKLRTWQKSLLEVSKRWCAEKLRVALMCVFFFRRRDHCGRCASSLSRSVPPSS